MFLFRTSPRLEDCAFFGSLADCHCHILPGVDDGVGTPRESFLILEKYAALGISEVWFTPHIMEDVPNTTAALKQRFAELQSAYSGPIRLQLSAEYMLDHLFASRFDSNDLLPWGNGHDSVLVETSIFSAPQGFRTMLGKISAKGYNPVLAHPERYRYMDEDDYMQIRRQGVEMQLNLFSLVGMYGKDVQQKAETLLKKGLYSHLGTDLHSYNSLEWALKRRINRKTLELLNGLCTAKD